MPDAILKNVPGMAAATHVPVLNAATLSEAEFKGTYVANGRPCVIKGAISHWPAIRKWQDRQYLKHICGAKTVPFWPHENHVTRERIAPGVTRKVFADAIDHLHDMGRGEVAAIGCDPGNAAMAADISGFSFFTEAALGFSYPMFRFFIYRNAGSSWHYHSFDETLMSQVIGTKRVGLLKVENPHRKALSNIFFKEDYYEDAAAFDELKDADLPWHVADLAPGDSLYIPPLWWHGVIVTSDGLGVTTPVSWRSSPQIIGQSLQKMAAGELELYGVFTIDQFRKLLEMARSLGLERELEIAWKRGVADQGISLFDQSGGRHERNPWPPA